ncbi:MAG: hypothetical protein WC533_01595 [Candidatus Pacearchaeota archaeon]
MRKYIRTVSSPWGIIHPFYVVQREIKDNKLLLREEEREVPEKPRQKISSMRYNKMQHIITTSRAEPVGLNEYPLDFGERLESLFLYSLEHPVKGRVLSWLLRERSYRDSE